MENDLLLRIGTSCRCVEWNRPAAWSDNIIPREPTVLYHVRRSLKVLHYVRIFRVCDSGCCGEDSCLVSVLAGVEDGWGMSCKLNVALAFVWEGRSGFGTRGTMMILSSLLLCYPHDIFSPRYINVSSYTVSHLSFCCDILNISCASHALSLRHISLLVPFSLSLSLATAWLLSSWIFTHQLLLHDWLLTNSWARSGS